MRDRLVLSFLLLGLALFAGPAGASSSSFSAFPDGTKVLYVFFKDLGYEVSRTFDVEGIDPLADLVVVLGPLVSYKAEALLARRSPHNALLFAPPLLQKDSICGDAAFGPHSIQRVRRLFSEKEQQPAKLRLRSSYCALRPPASAKVLAGTAKEALVYEISFGQLPALILVHDELVENRTLDEDDLSVVLRRWLVARVPSGGKIVFLEEKQGESIFALLRRTHLSGLVAHGALFLFLLYGCLLPRFGDPSAADPSARRAFAQHAVALGHLYQRRGASALLLKTQYERFLSRVLGPSDRRKTFQGMTGQVVAGQKLFDRATKANLIATRTGGDPMKIDLLLAQIEDVIRSPENAESRDIQRHFRLSRSLSLLEKNSLRRS